MRRRRLEAETRVISRVADQQDGADAGLARQFHGAHDQRHADAFAAPVGRDAERAQQNRRRSRRPDADRPVADRADEAFAVIGHPAQRGHRRHVHAIAVGFLVEAVGTENLVEQGFDRVLVVEGFGKIVDHRRLPGAGRTGSNCRIAAGPRRDLRSSGGPAGRPGARSLAADAALASSSQ